MSDQWRILVVEDEEALNHSIVNSLRKDGYAVQGVMNAADAIRILWSEECHVVISDLKMPGADGLELLQWVRAYRPNTRMIMVAPVGSDAARIQALEGGAVSYLEKPLDLHQLKEELRRLLQQTGFSASLDSFDLLDVIQIINMSRKSIALLVNTGLEERGILCFQTGELVWAEYGVLRGEEAFFALAAHKNGTVVQQNWSEQISPNVTQPLSRLIFQALQYRTKYASLQQPSGEHEALSTGGSLLGEIDDSPFVFLEDPLDTPPVTPPATHASTESERRQKEWWQKTGGVPRIDPVGPDKSSGSLPAAFGGMQTPGSANIVPSTVHKTPASQRNDLPAWLTDQPTNPNMRPLGSGPLASSSQSQIPVVPPTPVVKPSPEWTSTSRDGTEARTPPLQNTTGLQKPVSANGDGRKVVSAEWQVPEEVSPARNINGSLQSLASLKKSNNPPTPLPPVQNNRQESGAVASVEAVEASRSAVKKRNYPALVAALQTLGYSINGFIAAGIVGLDGQPIAQVAVDDLDISRMCGRFSSIMRGIYEAVEQGGWGDYEDTVITSSDHHILLRLVGGSKDTFQLLITSREADPIESLGLMANVEGAISAALG